MIHYENLNYVEQNTNDGQKLIYTMNYKVFYFIIKLFDYLNEDTIKIDDIDSKVKQI